MNRLLKVIAVTIILTLALSVNAFAMTQSELIEYVSKPHTINGTTYQMNSAYKREIENYVKDHPITDDQANQMKAKFDSFLSYIDSIGVRSIDECTHSQKQTLLAKANEITAVVGVSIKYNSTDKTLEFYDENGKMITAVSVYDYDKLVQTGSSNYVYFAIPATLAVVALAGVAVFKKRA